MIWWLQVHDMRASKDNVVCLALTKDAAYIDTRSVQKKNKMEEKRPRKVMQRIYPEVFPSLVRIVAGCGIVGTGQRRDAMKSEQQQGSARKAEEKDEGAA